MFDIVLKDLSREHQNKDTRDLLLHVLANQHFIIKKLDKIMSQQDDFIQAITDLKSEVDGIGVKVAALEAAINGQPTGTVAQPILDAFAALKGSVDTLNTAADNTLVTPPTTV